MQQFFNRPAAGSWSGISVACTFVLIAAVLTSSAWGQEKGDKKAESSDAAKVAFADAANFQNNGAFD